MFARFISFALGPRRQVVLHVLVASWYGVPVPTLLWSVWALQGRHAHSIAADDDPLQLVRRAALDRSSLPVEVATGAVSRASTVGSRPFTITFCCHLKQTCWKFSLNCRRVPAAAAAVWSVCHRHPRLPRQTSPPTQSSGELLGEGKQLQIFI